MWSTILSIIVVINELMASNAGKVMSPATNFDSWIELYNPSEQAVNLGGMYLSNDASNLKYWQEEFHFDQVLFDQFHLAFLGVFHLSLIHLVLSLNHLVESLSRLESLNYLVESLNHLANLNYLVESLNHLVSLSQNLNYLRSYQKFLWLHKYPKYNYR